MCSARSKENAKETYTKAKMTLEFMENRHHDKKVKLDTFPKDQGTYAACSFMDKRGTRSYYGLACLEQNHSSMLIHLNDRHRR